MKDGNRDIAVWDNLRGGMIDRTHDAPVDFCPVWMPPDGRQIVFGRGPGSNIGIYRMSADGAGNIEHLHTDEGRNVAPNSISKDGKILLFQKEKRSGLQIFDIGMLSMEAGNTWLPLLEEAYSETQPQISPDGKWMAYCSNESGRLQVYVRSFPEVDKMRMPISVDGGESPLWSPTGRELFYRRGDLVMAVAVETEPEFTAEKPEELFRGTYYSDPPGGNPSWDISPDGKRFLILKPSAAADPESSASSRINVVVNWFEELKARAPAK